jgi:hypothetical protein
LSEQEIQADLNELLDFLDDSDSSVVSAEILSSYYPVKPRKSQKRESILNVEEELPNFREIDSDLVDDALAFIKSLQSTRKDLFDAECNREELELLLQVNWRLFITILI